MGELTCITSGSLFVPRVHNQVRCSHRCTRRAAKAREGRRRRGGVDIPTVVACDLCGQPFKPYSYVGRWCSSSCRATARTRRRAHRHRIRRLAILDRDQWICQLCTEPIDPTLRFPDSRSATVDHIVPLVAGGSDEPSNLQAAHMVCNAAKGAKAPA